MRAERPLSSIKGTRTFAPHWHELHDIYPRSAVFLAIAITVFLLIDISLVCRHIRFVHEQSALQSAMVRAEIRRTEAQATAERSLVAARMHLARREALMDLTPHLSVDRAKGVMYLQRDRAVLREIPISLGPITAAPPDSTSLALAPPGGRRTVREVVDAGYPFQVPESVFLQLGEPVPADRTVTGALGPLAIVLDGGTVIHTRPESGPFNDARYLLPGAVRVEKADLLAIKETLHPGMRVYFY